MPISDQRRNHQTGNPVPNSVRAIHALLVVGVVSCSTLSETEQPPYRSVPGAFLSDTGASLYVFEAFDDWLDDGRDILSHTIPRSEEDYQFFDPSDPPPHVQNKGTSLMGEQALTLVLRWALSRETSKAKFIGHSDIQLKSGFPITLTLFNPEPEYPGPGGPGKRMAFRVRLKATTCKDPDLVSLEWEAEELTDGPDAEEAERPGQFPRTCKRINLGSGVLPLGATLFMHCPRGSNRSTYLLVRIASVDP